MKIAIFTNSVFGLQKFRLELVETLIQLRYEVVIVAPKDNYVSEFLAIGCKYEAINIDSRGTNPILDLVLVRSYIKILQRVKPDLMLSYTIKPNIYGGVACQILRIPYLSNITGLGSAIQNPGVIQKISLFLYRIGLRGANCVFVQNKMIRDYLLLKRVLPSKYKLIPGSGVNLDHHKFQDYPLTDSSITLLFVGRLIRDKGVRELLHVARLIREEYTQVNFNIIGWGSEEYTSLVTESAHNGIVQFLGKIDDIRPYLYKCHALVLPSYHEGLSNVLLEAAANGRPVIASNIPGCSETFVEGVTGFGFKPADIEDFKRAIVEFVNLEYERKVDMGIRGRVKVEREFDRKLVVHSYLNEIRSLVYNLY